MLQPDGTSWAVVIGVNTYQHPEIPALSYAVNDARSVAAALERLGFTAERVFLLLDAQATRQGIENVLYEHLRATATNDRLFVFFAAAFWMLAFQWALVAAIDPADEHRHLFYLPRLVAFALIAMGIVDKNRNLGSP